MYDYLSVITDGVNLMSLCCIKVRLINWIVSKIMKRVFFLVLETFLTVFPPRNDTFLWLYTIIWNFGCGHTACIDQYTSDWLCGIKRQHIFIHTYSILFMSTNTKIWYLFVRGHLLFLKKMYYRRQTSPCFMVLLLRRRSGVCSRTSCSITITTTTIKL